jgi:hypothetical protein
MVEISVMGLCVLLGMMLSYIVWSIATNNGERPMRRRCLWCGHRYRH